MNQPVIICVDDEQTILDSLKTELKQTFSEQYLIEIAQSGEEALELVEELLEEEYEIPLVICDYIMPNMKGDELLKRFHSLSPNTRKIMLTGQADFKAVANAIKYAKLYRYIPKPWDTEDLVLTVSEAIKSYVQDKQIAEKNKELEKKVKTFHKFVPVQFLELLNLEDSAPIELGTCVEKNMSIMFADIRGFTTLSEKMTPQENFNFINAYLSQMEPLIDQHHGFIDKYIGDGIMALFPIQANDAVQAAIAMLKKLVTYNQGRQHADYESISIGIGIHTGALMLGTVGGKNRMDGTVISDAVNLASRVESLTKTYGTPLLITEQTYQQLTDVSQYKIRNIDNVTVKGKTKSVIVYEVFDTDSSTSIEMKLKTKASFEQGIQCFHQAQFNDAQVFFKEVCQINGNDKVAQIYLNNCKNILSMIMPQSFHILIVDDIPLNVHALIHLLSKNNFEVSLAKSGEIALSMVKQNLPHLILLDVMMPGIDGFETCRRLKAEPQTQGIPIIFISGLTDTTDKIKGFKVGALDYITKPFQREEVLIRIKTHLNLSYLQRKCQLKTSLKISNLELRAKVKLMIAQGI
ncbi:MAG: diguanylate cyclase [Gammaproteobacteria bacterium]|nr:MAG: diguanylate cyclase [Gammaproteobacteria bacterium]RKZ44325.1 MAG: diguanylate cyclase [Gammaproteobacteria bacterium]RKZ76338.1 MAG: diguanylate cyclase [Gammaproteobacteria bacterium]